jgi:hypothetical protein
MLRVDRDKQRLDFDDVQILPRPDFDGLRRISPSFSEQAGWKVGATIIKAKVGDINLTLNMDGNDLHSGSLWCSMPQDSSASWDDAEANEAERAEVHLKLLMSIFGAHFGSIGPFTLEPVFDRKTFLQTISIKCQ